MNDPHAAVWSALARTLVSARGVLDSDVRRRILVAILPTSMRGYLQKVMRHAYRVTDEEVAEQVRAHGEDAVFEATTCAAFAAADLRVLAALAAVRGSEEKR